MLKGCGNLPGTAIKGWRLCSQWSESGVTPVAGEQSSKNPTMLNRCSSCVEGARELSRAGVWGGMGRAARTDAGHEAASGRKPWTLPP